MGRTAVASVEHRRAQESPAKVPQDLAVFGPTCRARVLLLRGAQGPDYLRTLRGLSHMLGTLEHNVLPNDQTA